MSSLMDKLKKNSKIKESNSLPDSKIFGKKDVIPTSVPMVNVALSGDVHGGLTSGLTVLAGPSKHFKSSFALLMARAYLDKYPDAVLFFYDSEFGSPNEYFRAAGIDVNRVFHTPITDIEKLKFDIMAQLEEIDRSDHLIIVVDSIGNLASKKEVEDALKENSAADMTRAKSLKSLFRMVTPHLALKDVPMICVNHTYQTQEMFSKAVVSGGTGIMYSADNVWILGRQQDKDGTEIKGYHFIINVEKSRFVKEKSKIPISVSWEGGIQRWSGLLDIAVEGEYVHKGKKGRSTGYSHMNKETGEVEEAVYYERETMNKDFWELIFKTTDFADYIKSKYKIVYRDIEEEPVIDEVLDDEDIVE